MLVWGYRRIPYLDPRAIIQVGAPVEIAAVANPSGRVVSSLIGPAGEGRRMGPRVEGGVPKVGVEPTRPCGQRFLR
ncbi:MAG TPA: hypothetical protein PLR44_03855, partial [Thermomicrobiales bacterium]|nr:hypothetical protein [Thermomicrobiales bacterium]